MERLDAVLKKLLSMRSDLEYEVREATWKLNFIDQLIDHAKKEGEKTCEKP